MNENRISLIAWCFYDWANSAFPTVITTFIFATYFTSKVAIDPINGTSQWGMAMALSALAVSIFGPIFGAIADQTGRRKPWLAVFTVLSATGAAMLWFVEPSSTFVIHALCWVILANFGFEMGMIFYNAMLPNLAPRDQLGRWSGWGWGLGYLGGLACLGTVLVAFVQVETPLFSLDKSASEELRITGPVVALWMVVFALPLFFFTPDSSPSNKSIAVSTIDGLRQLWNTLVQLRSYKNITWFLMARMLYTDGLNTLFAFGGIYAAGTFGLNFEELIIFGIGMNITAGLGALTFAWLDDHLGPKPIILIAIASLTVLGTALLVTENQSFFWFFGLSMGFFMGPAQSASRTMMGHMAPKSMRTEFYGLYALSGKATAFLGPACVAWVTSTFDSQRAGMTIILIFFLFGMVLLTKVPNGKY